MTIPGFDWGAKTRGTAATLNGFGGLVKSEACRWAGRDDAVRMYPLAHQRDASNYPSNVSLELKANEMNERLSLSTFTIEVDGKPTLAFGAKRYSEAEAICGGEELRAKLRLLKCGGVPICGENALLGVRLARPDEAALYRQAADSSQSTDELMLVYLVELDRPERQPA
jgi:hypothetical protein